MASLFCLSNFLSHEEPFIIDNRLSAADVPSMGYPHTRHCIPCPHPAPSAVKPSVQKDVWLVACEVQLIPFCATSAKTSIIGMDLIIHATGINDLYAKPLPPTHHT